ncbi:MAG: cell division protein ZapA [Schleiferiaceae bacterium]|nr:cell division protein ZapA [Schleiferiaceae bacterium]MDP4773587.1 cell division protein ZapA [Schleiferiaceae bacterium]MDP4854699.1 cell division protein ZapA [Schleiferiaceae bacterium]
MSTESIRIKVAIGGRTYPLTIPRHEEEQVRKAVALLQTTVGRFEERYAVGDKQDALAMAALQMANQVASLQSAPAAALGDQEDLRLKQIQAQLDAVLGTLRTSL